jgi:hypothetical protein
MSNKAKLDPVMLVEALELLVDKRRQERDDVISMIAQGVTFHGELVVARQRLEAAQKALDSVWIKPRDRGYAGIIFA